MQRDVDVLICVHFLGIYDFFIVECSSELFLLAPLDLHLTACLYMRSFSCGKYIDKKPFLKLLIISSETTKTNAALIHLLCVLIMH